MIDFIKNKYTDRKTRRLRERVLEKLMKNHGDEMSAYVDTLRAQNLSPEQFAAKYSEYMRQLLDRIAGKSLDHSKTYSAETQRDLTKIVEESGVLNTKKDSSNGE